MSKEQTPKQLWYNCARCPFVSTDYKEAVNHVIEKHKKKREAKN